jgi:hypothetical protein
MTRRGSSPGPQPPLWRLRGRGPRLALGRAGRGVRFPRPQRVWEDDHDPYAVRPAVPVGRTRRGPRRGHRPPGATNQGAHRVHVSALLALSRPHGRGESRLLRRRLWALAPWPGRAHPVGPGDGRPGRGRAQAGSRAVRGRQATLGPGMRRPPRAGHPLSRRTHRRRGSSRPPGVLGPDRHARGGRHHRVRDDALPRRGGALPPDWD